MDLKIGQGNPAQRTVCKLAPHRGLVQKRDAAACGHQGLDCAHTADFRDLPKIQNRAVSLLHGNITPVQQQGKIPQFRKRNGVAFKTGVKTGIRQRNKAVGFMGVECFIINLLIVVMGFVEWLPDNAQVDFAFVQIKQNVRGAGLRNLDIHIRIGAFVSIDPGRNQTIGDGIDGTDPNFNFGGNGFASDFVDCLVNQLENFLRTLFQQPRGLRDGQPSFRALKKLNPKFILQGLELKTERRLGNMITLFGTADKEPDTAEDLDLDLGSLEPMIACPFSPANVVPVSKVAGTPVTQVVVGSCTNGRLSDMEQVVNVFRGRKVSPEVNTLIVPASKEILEQMEERGWCKIMRGGTSKGIYLKANDLPDDPQKRDDLILEIFGSPDVRQINGLAGADPLTSKLAIIGPPTRPEADVDYTFAQVSIKERVVDYNGNCGNISSGVGPFAIDESMVRAVSPMTRVCIHNTNTGKLLYADVEVENGRAKVKGDCEIAGVPGTGSPILMDFSNTAGAATGKVLPTGNPVDVLETSCGPIQISIVDVANPCVFVLAKDVGMKGTETPDVINGNKELLEYLEEIRSKCCTMMDKMIPFPKFNEIIGLSRIREIEANYSTGRVVK